MVKGFFYRKQDIKNYFKQQPILSMNKAHADPNPLAPIRGPFPDNDDGGPIHKSGGSIDSGGAMAPGGSIPTGGAFPDNIKDAYHYILNMKPHALEMKREIAAQLLGAVPSDMWGNLLDEGKTALRSIPQHYEDIMRMPDVNHLARMVEGDHGGGFFDAVKHVGEIAHGVYKRGRLAAKYLNWFRDPIISALGLEDYKPFIEQFAETLSNADDVINPLMDTTYQILKFIPDDDTKNRAKDAATQHIRNMAQKAAKDLVIRR